VQITGDEKALARFLRLFPEPDPVALAASA
jgi:hypothetical protein